MRTMLLLLSALTCCDTAGAQTTQPKQTTQTIYRCDADGKTTYSSAPCSAGRERVIDVPPPTVAPDARVALARQQALLNKLGKEQAARDAHYAREAARARAASISVGKRCAKLKLKWKWADEDAAEAKGKHSATVRARRAREQLALDCPDQAL